MDVRHDSTVFGRWRRSRRLGPQKGFTLLELIISCAILVSVFAIAASSLTRIHRVRSQSKARSRLLTQGEEIMGFMADAFAHVAGTNILAKGNGGSLTLDMVRFEDLPPSATRSSAAGTLPFRRVALRLERSDDGIFTATRSSSRREHVGTETTAANNGEVARYQLVQDGDGVRTNAVAKEGHGTRLLPADKGDTILVPVTTTSTAGIYHETYGHGGRVDIVPSYDESTNIIFATVVFTNFISATATRSIQKPVAMAWPEPSETQSRLLAAAYALAGGVATNDMTSVTNGLANPALESWSMTYTNMPMTETVFEGAETNGASTTYLAVTMDAAMRRGLDDFSQVSSNDLAYGAIIYSAATNGARERIDLADYIWDLFAPDMPPGLATNLLSEMPCGPAAEDVFAPAVTNGVSPPFYIYQRLATSAMGGVAAFNVEFDLSATAASAYSDFPPITSHGYRRLLSLGTTTTITATNATSDIAFEATTISAFELRVPVPASTYPTNTYLYGGSWTNIMQDGTSTDTDVDWTEYVLDEDFEGADLTLPGIWLEEDGDVRRSHLRHYTNIVADVTAEPFAADELPTYGDHDEQLFWGAVHSITIRLLAFPETDGGRLDLVPWDPGRTTDPVCADIHLELLSPDDLRRASAIADETSRRFYIAHRLIRMDRRAQIGTRRSLPE